MPIVSKRSSSSPSVPAAFFIMAPHARQCLMRDSPDTYCSRSCRAVSVFSIPGCVCFSSLSLVSRGINAGFSLRSCHGHGAPGQVTRVAAGPTNRLFVFGRAGPHRQAAQACGDRGSGQERSPAPGRDQYHSPLKHTPVLIPPVS